MEELKISVPPLPWWARVLNALFVPIMHIITGTFFFFGRPQETHRWNNRRLTEEERRSLNPVLTVVANGNSGASPRWFFGIPLMHVPILGGWREYVVLKPIDENVTWYVGWDTDVAGVSLIPLKSEQARLLVGPGPCKWFGIRADTGEQIQIEKVGRGKLWKADRFKHVRLL